MAARLRREPQMATECAYVQHKRQTLRGASARGKTASKSGDMAIKDAGKTKELSHRNLELGQEKIRQHVCLAETNSSIGL